MMLKSFGSRPSLMDGTRRFANDEASPNLFVSMKMPTKDL